MPFGLGLATLLRSHRGVHRHRMEHLSALDASFLQAEDSDPHISLAVGGVSIITGPPPDYAELVEAFAARVQDIPRCTQMLHTRPLDIGPPQWVPDPHFDISHHLHRAALPQPGAIPSSSRSSPASWSAGLTVSVRYGSAGSSRG